MIEVLLDRVESLIQTLRDTERRDAAAKALVTIGYYAVMPLIGALEDGRESDDVRVAAAEVLGNLGDARAVGPLRDAVVDRDSEDVSEAAYSALQELISEGVVGWREAVVIEEERIDAELDLGRCDGDLVSEELLDELIQEDQEAREPAPWGEDEDYDEDYDEDEDW